MNVATPLRGFCSECSRDIAADEACLEFGDLRLVCADCTEAAGRAGKDEAPPASPYAGPPAPGNLAILCASGLVRRWHQNATMAATNQTLADHQGRCIQLLLALNPGARPALIRALAFHDVGEFGAGDLSGPMKSAQPGLAAQHAAFESAVRQDICGPDPWLTKGETAWLQLIDRMEAAAWVLLTRPWEWERKASGWAQAHLDILTRAEALGCRAPVEGLIADLLGGVW